MLARANVYSYFESTNISWCENFESFSISETLCTLIELLTGVIFSYSFLLINPLQLPVIGILGNQTSEMFDQQLAEMSTFDLNTNSDLGLQLSPPPADLPAATSTQVEVPLGFVSADTGVEVEI